LHSFSEEYYGKLRIAGTGDLTGSQFFSNTKEYQPLDYEVPSMLCIRIYITHKQKLLCLHLISHITLQNMKEE
jgi:hypothetical protein